MNMSNKDREQSKERKQRMTVTIYQERGEKEIGEEENGEEENGEEEDGEEEDGEEEDGEEEDGEEEDGEEEDGEEDREEDGEEDRDVAGIWGALGPDRPLASPVIWERFSSAVSSKMAATGYCTE
ncbi:prothymosin alpha-like [Linepithema humile]|uniref:prothymosin alpha-like n=1 Tax=Linepithema humile TaxID=83485 RepID=UPI00351F55A7